jgi:predicted DNA-binding transcriptional regulator YafY
MEDPGMDDEITHAIDKREVLTFTYAQRHRVVEPHVFGIHNGKKQLLGYQIRGESSSGGLPAWRRFDVDGIVDLKVTDEEFPAHRPPPAGEDTTWDTVVARV